MSVGSVGNHGLLVVVSVTVVTDVVIEVVVEGVGASVVVGVEEVGGTVEVIVVVSGGGAAVVWPVGAGAGASDSVGPGVEEVAELELLDVPAGLLEVPAPVNFTTA
ncbi:MAG: hypothetical protein KDB47_12815 [Mycobacterium sp.]|nr:hypothetical protein [Mycobacterium sp.]